MSDKLWHLRRTLNLKVEVAITTTLLLNYRKSNILDSLAQQLNLLYNPRDCDQDLLVLSFTYLNLIP